MGHIGDGKPSPSTEDEERRSQCVPAAAFQEAIPGPLPKAAASECSAPTSAAPAEALKACGLKLTLSPHNRCNIGTLATVQNVYALQFCLGPPPSKESRTHPCLTLFRSRYSKWKWPPCCARIEGPLGLDPKIVGLMAAAISAIELGLLRMCPLQTWLNVFHLQPKRDRHCRLTVSHTCSAALRWSRMPSHMRGGVRIGVALTHQVMMTDSSGLGGWPEKAEESMAPGIEGPLGLDPKIVGLMAAAISAIELGLLRMCPLQTWLNVFHLQPKRDRHCRLTVSHTCSAALRWSRMPSHMRGGVRIGVALTHQVMMTDSSGLGGWPGKAEESMSPGRAVG
ncbi:UNVERIFIED_CONTAM: hypothetical protein FKN15_065203 [Acipenser sinensis]